MAHTDDRPATVQIMYDSRTVDTLKAIGGHLLGILKETAAGRGGASGAPSIDLRLPARKAELVEWIVKLAHNEAYLKDYYKRMSLIEQTALQEVVHSEEAALDTFRFKTKYGATPGISASGWTYRRNGGNFPALSFLLPSNGKMAFELRSRLKKLIPKPKECNVSFLAELPEEVEVYRGEASAPLAPHNTEQAAIQDLAAVLRLVDMGKVGVSAKTARISQAGANAIRKVLSQGDYYPEEMEARSKYDVQIGPLGIRPFAWGMLLQAGNLARPGGSKLELTRAGRAALGKPPQDALAGLWERWLKNKLIHEMNRIEIIKGQKSAKHPLSAAEPGRGQIALVLSKLEEGKWVRAEDFFKFLIAEGHGFDVVRNSWALYIADPQYGALEYGDSGWKYTSGRFARAFLLEYAATLGVIDVALVPPWGALDDHGGLWGAGDLSCLSRYDGLWALRLNSLGAWILGKKEHYEPTFHDEPSLRVLPNMEITFGGSSI